LQWPGMADAETKGQLGNLGIWGASKKESWRKGAGPSSYPCSCPCCEVGAGLGE
jgi:hypothetical protein